MPNVLPRAVGTPNTTSTEELRDIAKSFGFVLPDYALKANGLAIKAANESRKRCAECTSRATCASELPGYMSEPVLYAGGVSIVYRRCAKDIDQERRQKAEQLLVSSRLPDFMRGKTFENFRVMAHNRAAFDNAIDAATSDRGLLLIGSPGTGKTHLAAAIANHRMANLREVIFVTVPELMGDIRQAIREERETELMQLVKGCELLVLDDLGAERSTEWVMEQLFVLINARYLAKMQTVVTSNYAKSDLVEKMGGLPGQRIISRLSEMCATVRLDGPDYRLGVE